MSRMPYQVEDVTSLTILQIFAKTHDVEVYFELAPLEGEGKVEMVVRVEAMANGYAYARYISPRMLEKAVDPREALANECRMIAQKIVELAAM